MTSEERKAQVNKLMDLIIEKKDNFEDAEVLRLLNSLYGTGIPVISFVDMLKKVLIINN